MNDRPLPDSSTDSTLDTVPAAVLDRPVEGCGLRRATLREELGADTTHVVFLRHFG